MTASNDFKQVTVVELSDEERDSHTISEENVARALVAMHRDGIVALGNAVQIDHIDSLNKMLSDEANVMAKLETTHFNDTNGDMGGKTGNMSQGPPLQPELMYDDVWANGPALGVISSIFGPKPRVNYVNGNTALGGFNGARQRVHADLTFNHAQFPFGIVTNYYLVDTSPANGSTELWLGTHRDTSFKDHRNFGVSNGYQPGEEFKFGIKDELLDKRRAVHPPIQPTLKRGAVVLRDLRLWHAGLANPADHHRIMLAFVHTPWWYKCPTPVVLPEAARGLVEKWKTQKFPVEYNAHFVPGDVDHKTIQFTPNFDSANEGYLESLPKWDFPVQNGTKAAANGINGTNGTNGIHATNGANSVPVQA